MEKIVFLKHKSVLIVDDLPEFRSAVRRMIEGFGCQNVEMAATGEEAIEYMRKQSFDVVLCDYNLGEGRDGQQVLEEGKFKRYLKENQTFLLITAESTNEMVMGALEYEPDGYLIKPFNIATLQLRLEKINEIKQELKAIHQAIDEEDNPTIIQLCQEKIAAQKAVPQCTKILGAALVTAKQFDAAKTVFELALKQNSKQAWALLGLGKAQFYAENYVEAAAVFQKILDLGTVFVEALDWLAKAKLALGLKKEAQRLLEKALKISPKAILRQQALAEVALQNNDTETAEKALRQAVGLGKNSVYRNENDFFNLADTLLVKATSTTAGFQGKRASDEALSVLEGMSSLYPDDPAVLVKSKLIQSQAYVIAGRPDQAKLMVRKAEEIIDKNDVVLDPALTLKLAKTFVQLGDKSKGEAMIKQVLASADCDASILSQAEAIADDLNLVVNEKSLNKQGIKLHESGKLQEAAELFEKAVTEMQGNYSVVLNAAQSYLQYMKKKGTHPEGVKKVRGYLDSIKDIDKEDKRYDRYVQIVKLYKDTCK